MPNIFICFFFSSETVLNLIMKYGFAAKNGTERSWDKMLRGFTPTVLARKLCMEPYLERERENIVNIDLSYRYLGYIQYPTIDSLPRIHFVSNHRYLTSDTFCIQLKIPRIHFVSNIRYLGYILYPIIDTQDTFYIQLQIPRIHFVFNKRYLGFILYPTIDTLPRTDFVSNHYRYLTQDTFCIELFVLFIFCCQAMYFKLLII